MSELRWILVGCGALLLLGIVLWGRRGRNQAAVDEIDVHNRLDPGIETVSVPVLAPDPLLSEGATRSVQSAGSRWQDNEWADTVTDLPEIRFDASPGFDDPLVPQPDEEILPPMSEAFQAEPAHAVNPASATVPAAEAPKKQPEKRKIVALRLTAPLTGRYAGPQLRAAFDAAGLAHGKYGIFHRLHGDRSVFSVASMVEPGSFDLATMAETQFAGVTLFTLLPGPVAGAQAYDQLIDCARRLERTLGGELHDERGIPLTAQRIAALRDEVLDFEHLLGRSAGTPG